MKINEVIYRKVQPGLKVLSEMDRKMLYAFRGWIAFVAFMDLGTSFRSYIEHRSFLGDHTDTQYIEGKSIYKNTKMLIVGYKWWVVVRLNECVCLWLRYIIIFLMSIDFHASAMTTTKGKKNEYYFHMCVRA